MNRLSIKKRGKKAQITVFIILGIILLFGAGTAIYMKQAGIGPAKIFQTKTPPVEEFIKACMEKTAEEGIRALGTQGGFISIPEEIAANPSRFITIIPGVPAELAPKVPYWYWEGKTIVPGLRFMEQQVEYYIDQNIQTCINNFTGFRDQFDIKTGDKWKSNVVFADKDTVVSLDWDVEIKEKGQEKVTKKKQFLVNLDVKVKRMYELARELLDAENKKKMFEKMTIDLMASFPSKDIPFDGLTLKCGREVWRLSQIKEKLIKALEPTVMGIRFRNTDHPPFLAKEDAYIKVHQAVQAQKEAKEYRPLVLPKEIPPDSYDYFQLYFNFTDKNYNDLKVTANFRKGWGLNIYATPNQYGILKSGVQDLRSKILTFLCLNTYHFVYDLYYPVMISIEDPKAFRGKSYVFRFAFPVMIYHNQGDRNALPAVEFNPDEFDLDFCDYHGTEKHTIRVVDAVTNAELSRVNLTYRCFTNACNLGSTRTNNQHLQWKGNFPSGCANPTIEVKRKGYLDASAQWSGQEPFVIKMHPTQELKFTLRKHRSGEPDSWRFLQPDEHAVIGIEHKDPDMSLFYTFTPEETFKSKKTLELLQEDATYDLSIMLFKQKGADEDVMTGGWVGKWKVNYEDIADANKVEFHILEKFPPPTTDQEFVDMYELISNHTKNPDIKPIFKKVGETDDAPAGSAGAETVENQANN